MLRIKGTKLVIQYCSSLVLGIHFSFRSHSHPAGRSNRAEIDTAVIVTLMLNEV